MNTKTLLGATIAAAMTLGVFSTAAFADDNEVVVQAPYKIQRSVTRLGASAGEERVTVSKYVATRDLDLRYRRDANLLFSRVDYAAQDVCRQAMVASPVSYTTGGTSQRECYLEARRTGMKQAERLIRASY